MIFIFYTLLESFQSLPNQYCQIFQDETEYQKNSCILQLQVLSLHNQNLQLLHHHFWVRHDMNGQNKPMSHLEFLVGSSSAVPPPAPPQAAAPFSRIGR